MIKAIIFDFFGVICSNEYWRSLKTHENLADKFKELAQAVNLGNISWQDFVGRIAEATGQSPEEVERLYNTEQIHPALVAYIDKLHASYRTALLTNASATFVDSLIQESGLAKVFDEIVISSRIGIAKPDPRIYTYTLEKLRVEPEEAVFIDDSPVRVAGAAQIGLRTILYQDFTEMKDKLEKLLAAVSDN